jgi:hypothetical protein
MFKILTHDNGRFAFAGTIVIWLVYALFSFLAPNRGNVYNLNMIQSTILQLTIMLPILVVWLAAVYGAVRFKQYANLISNSPDGKALQVLTDGLLVLVLSFIVQSFLGLLARYVVDTPLLIPTVMLRNHLPTLLSLIALWLIYAGSNILARQAKARFTTDRLLAMMVPFSLGVALFSAFFYSHLRHEVTNGIPNFSLPDRLPFFTMALPYIVVWLFGLLAIANIFAYIKNVKGAIYRSALRYLAMGIVAVLIFTILLQVTVLFGTALSKLQLGPLLLLVYLILILYGSGFVLIAKGARSLTRIEVIQ